jgi:pimeloyl-ACP methyl ester carboxylesterase
MVDRYTTLPGRAASIADFNVAAVARAEQIDNASHWIPLDAPDRLNQLLLEWLG